MSAGDMGATMTREDCWDYGIRLRKLLVARYMAVHGLRDRPLLKKVVDGLAEDALGARLLEDVLPLDRFAQTEVVDGRIVITVNTLIPRMPRVNDPVGVAYVSRWHEMVHAAREILRAHDLESAPGRDAALEALDQLAGGLDEDDLAMLVDVTAESARPSRRPCSRGLSEPGPVRRTRGALKRPGRAPAAVRPIAPRSMACSGSSAPEMAKSPFR